jgi:peptidyl-prolyl cis-trans isomerase B (cyclophilin B)
MSKIFIVLIFIASLFSLDMDQFNKAGYKFETDSGSISIILFNQIAPNHCQNFKKLFNSDLYDGMAFHRVIAGFMNQIGDPNTKDKPKKSWGSGNIGEETNSEINKIHFRGAVAAARTADEINPEMRSSGSQFYICVRPQHQLDGKYTVFGSVIEGLDIVDNINRAQTDESDRPLEDIRVISTSTFNYFDKDEYEWTKRKLEE